MNIKILVLKFQYEAYIILGDDYMEILRYFFLFGIVAGSTSIGFIISKGYSERLDELNAFNTLINILQNTIKFTKLPLKDIFEQIGNITIKTRVKNIFINCSQKIKDTTLENAWKQAIDEEMDYLNMKNEDFDVIETLGNTLGKTDIDGQMNELNQFKERLNIQIKQAEEEKRKNSKMFKSLGTIAGLVLVIILF